MYARDGVSAAMEELGCKGGPLSSSGYSLLQQLGCWHLNLNCWVSPSLLSGPSALASLALFPSSSSLASRPGTARRGGWVRLWVGGGIGTDTVRRL